MDMTSVFAEIVKSTPQEDGSLLVYGKATGSDLDLDQQRCDPEWLKRAMPEWFEIGNVRAQHNAKDAVGKAVEHEVKGDGHWIKANIIDPIAVAKTKAGVFTGFSIGIAGPRISKSVDAPNGIINDGKIVEVSLVDRPCLPTATLTVCKAAAAGWEGSPTDLDEERGLVKCEELTETDEETAEKTLTTVEDAQQAADDTLAKAGDDDDEQKPETDIVEKTTDVDHLDAPAPGQKCDTCGEDGHLSCVAVDTEKATDWAAEATAETMDGASGCGCCNNCICSETKAAEKAVEFDVDAAKALVQDIAKADGVLPPEYSDEQGDVKNAQAAIGIISQLIVSEANEMTANPAEDCDIRLLLEAVSALRCFIGREQQQAMGENDVDHGADVLVLAADADLEKAKYNAEQLQAMLKAGKAMKNPAGDPSYPIGDKEDLENAIHAVGRGSGDHGAIRAYIKRRANALGASNLIPDSWSGSSKAADIEETDVPEPVETADKTVDPETTKAAIEESTPDGDALVNALSAALEKADNPLRKMFETIVEASTETTAKSLSDLGERLVKVEQMATPGGPALRRTEADRNTARKNDLLSEAARYKMLATSSDDLDLRRGYATKAAQIEAQVKAL